MSDEALVKARDAAWLRRLWQPIETADTSQLFAHSTWVLVATDEPRVTEAMPLYTSGDKYIWIAARGDNLRGNTGGEYLRYSATHWMPLPSPPTSKGDDHG